MIYKIGKIKNIKNGTQPYELNKYMYILMRIYIKYIFLPIFTIAQEIYENTSMY